MKNKKSIESLIEKLELRKHIKLSQEDDNKLDTIHFLDVGDLVRIIYSLKWVLDDDNDEFLGSKDV